MVKKAMTSEEPLATKGDLAAAIAPLATKQEMMAAIAAAFAPLATRSQMLTLHESLTSDVQILARGVLSVQADVASLKTDFASMKTDIQLLTDSVRGLHTKIDARPKRSR